MFSTSTKVLSCDNRFIQSEKNKMYIVKKYGEPSLLTYSLVYYDFFEAIHACLKQPNSCVIRADSICKGEKELFVPRSI